MQFTAAELIGGLAAAMVVPIAGAAWDGLGGNDTAIPAVETVMLRPGSFTHPQPGEFLKEGRTVAAPRVVVEIVDPFEIMKFQVSLGDYARCAAEGACKPTDARGTGDVPVTGVGHRDAEAYARWYSDMTGDSWRLPTDQEWAYAAGERFRGDIESVDEDPRNPARGWLSSYQREVDLARKPDPQPRTRGAFGANENGIGDMAGNVWEWTSSCYVRTTFSPNDDTVASAVDNCGVHVVEGLHRTYMSNFIRDGKSGGCAVGLPPDNLGFRLVREQSGMLGIAGLRSRLHSLLQVTNS
jgi:formylglycine-generating enzyme required for sulfatase activity